MKGGGEGEEEGRERRRGGRGGGEGEEEGRERRRQMRKEGWEKGRGEKLGGGKKENRSVKGKWVKMKCEKGVSDSS